MSPVLSALKDMRGVRVVHATPEDIVVAAFAPRKFTLSQVFSGVCRYLSEQVPMELEKPGPHDIVWRKRLAPQVARIRAINGVELPEPPNLWMRLPTRGDRRRRSAHAEAELRRQVLGELEDGRDPFVLLVGTLIKWASHTTWMQNIALKA